MAREIIFLGLLFIVLSATVFVTVVPPHVIGRDFDIVCSAAAVGLTLLMLFWNRHEGTLDWTEPPVWISFWVFLNVVCPVWLMARREELQTTLLGLTVDMPQAVILICVGLLGLWAGHMIQPSSRKWRRCFRVPIVERAAAVWVFGVLAMTFTTVAGIGRNPIAGELGMERWANYLQFAAALGVLARNVLLIHYLRERPHIGWRLVAASLLFDVSISVLAAKKGFVISLFMLAMCIHYGTRKIRLQHVIGAALITAFFVPVVNTSRVLQALQPDAQFEGRAAALGEAIQSVASREARELGEDLSATVVGRQGSLLTTTALVQAVHPSVSSYEGWNLAVEIGRSLVPRFLSPNKTIGASELYRATTRYWGAATEYSFTSIGQFADAYRAGGYAFLFGWFALTGWLLGKFYYRGDGGRDPVSSAWYVTVLFTVLYYEHDLTTCVVRLVQFCPLMWALLHVITTSRNAFPKSSTAVISK